MLCALILRKMSAERREQSSDEIEALHNAAMVRYTRCFEGGVRTSFLLTRAWIECLGPTSLATHDIVPTLRNRHVAHSVNDWEINVPVVYLLHDRVTGSYAVHAVSVEQDRVSCLPREFVEQLRDLCRALTVTLRHERDAECKRLYAIAKSLPISDLVDRIDTVARFQAPDRWIRGGRR